VNRAVNGIHFKMEGVREIMDLVEMGDFATVLDLEGAYHHIRVTPELSRYFGFRFKGKDYLCNGLPFGYIQSPAIFYRILNVAINAIRE
jgi:hypothetical protein